MTDVKKYTMELGSVEDGDGALTVVQSVDGSLYVMELSESLLVDIKEDRALSFTVGELINLRDFITKILDDRIPMW